MLLRWTRSISAIALNTFREAVRNKVLGSLVFFAVILILVSIAFGQLSLHTEVRVARDLTYFTTAVFTMVIAVYTSVTLLHTEIEKRTIYTILSKPIRRWEFLLGKFLGIQGLLLIILISLFGVSSGVIIMQGGDIHSALAWGHVTLAFQMWIVAAVALLLATFSSPLLSGMITVAVFIAGNLVSQIKQVELMLQDSGNPVWIPIRGVRYVLPDLEALNLATEITYSIAIPFEFMASAAWYAAAYTAVVLALAMVIFAHRDFV
ncbi:MAG: ABC transporter permease [Myxococcota bacterium]